ncbi:MAG: hypothetical protein M0017_13940 [Desulfobacteraceae bacterium]|nr:hypothetical protein [Desulfobacteraceae bacterium]
MKERCGQAKEKMQGVGERARERFSRLTETFRRRAGETAEDLRQRTGHVGEYQAAAGERGREMKWRFQAAMREQPLAMGALFFSVGAAVGAILPITRREARLMSGPREEMVEKTEEMAQEQLEKAKETARETGEAVEAEVKRRLAGGRTEGARTREKEPAL